MTIRRNFPSALAAVAICFAASSARAGELNASLSAREAYVGAPVTLRLEIANASTHDDPVLPDVAGLDIQSAGVPSRSTQTTIINGHRTDRTSAVYAWNIIPRREGSFVIPGISIQVDGKTQTTTPQRFVATKSETGDLLFVDVTGQQQKIYVGQALKLTLNIWIKPYRDAVHQLTVSEADTWRMISEATNWGSFTERLSELARNNQRPAGEEVLRKDATGTEHSYYRYQIEASIYPKRPGQIDADDLQIVVNYPTRLAESRDPFDSMFDSEFFKSKFQRKTLTIAASRPLVSQATVAPIEVLPIPTAGRPADYRGAVGQYQIVTHAMPTSVKAGDPITLQIGIAGDGPMDLVQAPPLVVLPELTADFKVTSEPLAGIVEGNAKLFTASIRPRHAGITQIPAIPLSFFDPAAEKFVTVKSEPIVISVAEADRLALGSIVGAANAVGPGPEKSGTTTPQIDLSNYTGAEAIVSQSAHSPWVLVLAVIFPPLLVVSFWGYRHRQRLDDLLRGTARRRLRIAQQAIDSAQSPSEVASAVKDYVAGILRQPSASLTRSEIRAGLLSNGYQGSVQLLDDVLACCEKAVYACSNDGQLAAMKSSALSALAELSSVRSRKTYGELARPNKLSRIVAIACLLLAAFAAIVPTVALSTRNRAGLNDAASTPTAILPAKAKGADALSLSPSQRTAILSEANDAYQQGVNSTSNDAATAKEAFSKAASKYQLLVDSGVNNSELYCNLGNAYLQSGSLGRAIANYERALLLAPTNSKARANLSVARQGIPIKVSGTTVGTSWSNTLDDVAARLSWFLPTGEGTMLLVASWIIMWTTVLAGFYLSNRRWRYALIPATCLLLACAALSGLEGRAHPQGQIGIVAAPAAVLRQAPGDNFPAVTNQPLTEGQTLTVLRDRDSWLQVQTPDGQSGWVAAAQIERVAPSQCRPT